jgi:hypothetical protein
MFKKPKVKDVQMPPIPPPAPLPQENFQTEETEMKKARKRRGWIQAILAGSLSPQSGKKTTFGR